MKLLIERLALLEDLAWGEAAQAVLQTSPVVEADAFVDTLMQLENG
nr:hypothetical protein [Petrachloros mirabilis]